MNIPPELEAKIVHATNCRCPRCCPKAIDLGSAAVVDVPLPPSTNNLYLNVAWRGRVKSPEYRAWIDVASMLVLLLKPIRTKPFTITYTLVGGDGLNLGRDLGNFEKPLTDVLVSTGRIPGDSLRAGLWQIIQQYVECYEGEPYVGIEPKVLT